MTDEEIIDNWRQENHSHYVRMSTMNENWLLDLIRRVREDEREACAAELKTTWTDEWVYSNCEISVAQCSKLCDRWSNAIRNRKDQP